MKKKKYLKWSDYERMLIISHNRKFGIANVEILCQKMPNRSFSSINCELKKFDCWLKTGIMEFKSSEKHRQERAGVRETYTRLISELF